MAALSFLKTKEINSSSPSGTALNLSGKIETLDHTHPSAIQEVIVETNKNGNQRKKGLPACTSGKLQAKGVGIFSGNLRLAGSLARSCTPKG